MWMGLVRLSALSDYRATKGIYRLETPSSTITRNRYQLLLSLLHFSDNESILQDLEKIQPNEKTMGVLAYNKRKSGSDLSDHLDLYATTLRKDVKWYRKQSHYSKLIVLQ
ncbi:hypothetical protein HHI36_012986 [Cryptolaemus montrouzieri]|uniref:PiggyBac transposable element-derived protein domain-containing protein n=1 Tax=Cryptolaemus montrouzieri TaxID=559131 RepID=A0ABD2NH70_9CUCU